MHFRKSHVKYLFVDGSMSRCPTAPLEKPAKRFSLVSRWKRLKQLTKRILKNSSVLDTYPISCTLNLGSVPPFFTISLIWLNLDPFYLFLRYLPPYFRLNSTLELFIRAALMFFCVAEIMRTFSYNPLIVFSASHMSTFCLKVIHQTSMRGGLLGNMKIYNEFLVILAQLTNYSFGIKLIFLHCFIVVTSWITFKAFGHLPIYIYGFVPTFLAQAIFQAVLLLKEWVLIKESALDLTRNWRYSLHDSVWKKCKHFGHLKFKQTVSPYIKRKAMASRPMFFTCFGIFIPTKPSRLMYLSYTVDNITNALLLVPI